MLLRFQANVYAFPSTAVAGPVRKLRGHDLPSLTGKAGGPPLFLDVLPVKFEEMQQRLFELPRCDCEPDGFFLVTGHTEEGAFWKLNGHMQEYQPEDADEPSMHRCELSGECPVGHLDMVLRTMGWPEAELVFELVQEGVTLRESEFRKYAESHVVPTEVPRVAATDLTNDPASEGPGDRAPEAPAEPVPASRHGRDDVALSQRSGERKGELEGNEAKKGDSAHARTAWHITFGTYGTRLHGDHRPTVDREHNEYGAPFVERSDQRRERAESDLVGEPVRLSHEQRVLIEQALPVICERGGWTLHAAAAQTDHVHVVCEIASEVHGEKAQRLMKRWLSEALNREWPDSDRPRWWAVQGSNKAIREDSYLQNAVAYVEKQRASG